MTDTTTMTTSNEPDSINHLPVRLKPGQLVRTPLFQHQQDARIKFQDEKAIIIGWDMGTGKTLFGIERDLHLRDRFTEVPPFRTLVVAPLGTHDSWYATWKEETDLRVKVIDKKDRNSFLKGKYDVFIMHWDVVRLMPELRDFFDHAIFDECHRIKNRKAAVTKATKKLKPLMITDMSGSPATDRPQDLWSILNHVRPRDHRSYHRHIGRYVEQEDVYVYNNVTDRSEARFKKLGGPTEAWIEEGLEEIQEYYERVEIQDVHDMPSKLYQNRYVDLMPTQRLLYNEMDEAMLTWVKNLEGGLTPMVAPAVIAKLQRLQQFALAHMKWDDDKEKFTMSGPSPKLDEALSLIEETETDQYVIFSQFKSPLLLLKRMMDKRAKNRGGPMTNVLYTGDVKDIDRKANKEKFIAGDKQVFMATIGAAGEGVDRLQHATNKMIFLDRDWSPMRNNQAEARLWRIGQTKPVIITDIMAKDTVDFSRKDTINMKKDWVMATLGSRYS